MLSDRYEGFIFRETIKSFSSLLTSISKSATVGIAFSADQFGLLQLVDIAGAYLAKIPFGASELVDIDGYKLLYFFVLLHRLPLWQ